MRVKTRGLYHPTKDKLFWIEEKCSELKCIDPVGERDYPCSKCRLSERFERLAGVRLEELEQVR